MRVVALVLTLIAATFQPAVAHACRVLPWEIRAGETSQSAIMRRDQERLTPQLKTNVILARVVSAEARSTGQYLVFESLVAIRGSAPTGRLSAETDGSCYPAYPWRADESAILYLDHTAGTAEVELAVPPRQNIDPTIARDLRIVANTLRQSAP